ncbi:MAG: F-type H+-transporting ATPase subunit delta [Salibacteraceae bacterium]|jgi:F-type H+-transporting ATPase subunit delta
MKLNKASKRYAKALLTFAIERKELDTVYSDVQSLQLALEGSNELAVMMNSAAIQESKKTEIYKAIFADKISATTLNFLLLIAKNSRSSVIPHILNAFETQYKVHKNIVSVSITTASKMDDQLKNDLVAFLKKDAPDSTIEINEEINTDLIGGFIFRTDTHQIDASVANRLKTLKRELHNTTYTSKL